MTELAMRTDVKVVKPRDLDTVDIPVRSPLAVRCFGLTDRGRERKSNEDQFLVAELVKSLRVRHTKLPAAGARHSSDQSHLFVVADGIGGNAGGERASELAIDSVEAFVLETLQWFANLRGREGDAVFADFRKALAVAHARLQNEATAHAELQGMGTTLTMAFCLNADLFVAHAGDSRCYLFRAGRLYRLTADHTVSEEMVQAGALKAEDAAKSPWRHVITNALGGESPEIKVELHKLGLLAGDVLLLCSDGLTGMVSEQEVAEVLTSEADPEAATRGLVMRANGAGGQDNITVIVASFEDE